MTDAFKALNKSISNKNLQREDIFILGDFNINYKNKQTPSYKKLAFFEISNSLKQVISKATRITNKTNSILDLVLTNSKYIAQAGTLDTFISDHQPIFVLKKKIKIQTEGTKFSGRAYKNISEENFVNNLRKENWDTFHRSVDVNNQWTLIKQAITKELDRQCPINNFSFNKAKPIYIHKDIMEQIKNRNYFYRKAKLTHNEDDWKIAKFLRNQTNSNIRKARAETIQNELENSKNDSSRFWRQINQIFPKKSDKKHSDIRLTDNGVCVEQNNTAQYINEFFVNVGNTV